MRRQKKKDGNDEKKERKKENEDKWGQMKKDGKDEKVINERKKNTEEKCYNQKIISQNFIEAVTHTLWCKEIRPPRKNAKI